MKRYRKVECSHFLSLAEGRELPGRVREELFGKRCATGASQVVLVVKNRPMKRSLVDYSPQSCRVGND